MKQNRRIAKRIILTLAGLMIGSVLFAQERPNILFILSDDHSVPYLGCYGNPDLTTPNIDRLAEEGMRFDHMYTTASQCAPSRSSMMTGRSVTDIQQSRFSASLNPEIPVYPEMLRLGGYYSGVCGRSYHTDGSGGKAKITEQVFDEYNLVSFPRRLDYVRHKKDDDNLVLQMREFLDQVPSGKPWFLQAGFSDPHRRFTAPEYAPDPASITVPPGMPDTQKLREDLAQHYGEINRLDANVGKLIDELEARGIKDQTLIVFMGDNGGAIFRGKGTLWDTGLHVPMVARLPGVVPAGSVSEVLLSGEDIAPTFLDVA
ncbi:MAG TPA: sulfatase-like hydrolase/transferase, partial [Tichowtungia sp.]|nr:sulfatase-like hydrolase/transferase [Tichowtungia sp.]